VFDRVGDFVGFCEGDEEDQIEGFQGAGDAGEQPALRQPFEALVGAGDVEIGEEIERRAVEDDSLAARLFEDQAAAFDKLRLEIGGGGLCGESDPALGQPPIGLGDGLIGGMRGDEILDQRGLAAAVGSGDCDAHRAARPARQAPKRCST